MRLKCTYTYTKVYRFAHTSGEQAMNEFRRLCLTCTHWAPPRKTQEQRDMGKLGWFLCALGPRWTFHPENFGCDRHAPAAPEIVDARERWLAK